MSAITIQRSELKPRLTTSQRSERDSVTRSNGLIRHWTSAFERIWIHSAESLKVVVHSPCNSSPNKGQAKQYLKPPFMLRMRIDTAIELNCWVSIIKMMLMTIQFEFNCSPRFARNRVLCCCCCIFKLASERLSDISRKVSAHFHSCNFWGRLTQNAEYRTRKDLVIKPLLGSLSRLWQLKMNQVRRS